MVNLAASITSARGNLASTSTAFSLALTNLSSSAKEYFSVADNIELRFKELEEKETALKVLEEQITKKNKDLEAREKTCVERENKVSQREKDVGVKEAEWKSTEQRMALNASKIPTLVNLNVGTFVPILITMFFPLKCAKT